jgi:hypothetical protein
VTVATYLLYMVAAFEVINAILAFSTAGPVTDALGDVYSGTANGDSIKSIAVAAYIGGGVINILLAIGFGLLGLFDGRGKNVARILTWVVGGISLCCVGAGLGGNAMAGSFESSNASGAPSQTEVQSRIDAAVPSWYSPATTTIAVIALLAILTTLILLALPASNEFFRKPAPGAWDPSAAYPYPGQPGQPGQPPYPGQAGQPPYPGQAGQPPYPGQAGQPPYPGQFGQQGQPGEPAPGLPPYPGQSTPPGGDPSGEEPPRPPSNPA